MAAAQIGPATRFLGTRLAAAAASLVLCFAAPSTATELIEPPVFSSVNGVLDLLMIARAEPIAFGTAHAEGWIYEICKRPASPDNVCPPNSTAWYGGARLQLQPGDTLKIRLVNRLPPAPDAKHASDPGLGYLTLNPTNLHTHGMLVSPHYPTLAHPNYGDNVFVLTLNSANGSPKAHSHIHGDVRFDFTDYEIKIPRDHPSGLFWFHPHVHGISLNQISAGMAGIITVGSPRDYICRDNTCGRWLADVPIRHLILKDTQILASGQLVDQQEPTFCPQFNSPGSLPRRGECIGYVDSEDKEAPTPIPGHWFFTINGQQYPDISVAAPRGEIWRITNASASVTYNLALRTQGRDMLMQIVAIDGVSVSPRPGSTAADLARIHGTSLGLAPCPRMPGVVDGLASDPICARRLVMWPSSRVEVWVTYRDSNDLPATPPPRAVARLVTLGMNTGPGGDAWPRVGLARVKFASDAGSGAVPPVLSVQGQANSLLYPNRLAAELSGANNLFRPEADCKPLAPGHMRRIFFNSINPPGTQAADDAEGAFGLGYEELDENGVPVPGTFVDVSVFDPTKPTICLTLGPGNTPVTERWQLVNLASEDHNFHMHQAKFRLVSADRVEGTEPPRVGVLHDNVPVPHADGTCNSVADWRNGLCTAHPVVVEIPFTIAGDYVYHCHILEHEDGGMMAVIRVRRSR